MITEKIFQSRINEYLSHQREENVLYVTDLVRCPLTLKYEQEYKDLATQNTLNPATILGTFVHEGLENLLKNVYSFNIETEVETERTVIIEGKAIKLKGRMDAVIEENGEKVVVEIKSSRSDRGIPYEHHKTQLQIYLWMTGIKKGLLVYTTPDRIAEFPVERPLDDSEAIKLIEETVKMAKAPRYQWECKFCIYSKVCQVIQQQAQNTQTSSTS